jgi:hypothetical protein
MNKAMQNIRDYDMHHKKIVEHLKPDRSEDDLLVEELKIVMPMVATWQNVEKKMENMINGYVYFQGEMKKLWNYIHHTIKDETPVEDRRKIIKYRLVGNIEVEDDNYVYSEDQPTNNARLAAIAWASSRREDMEKSKSRAKSRAYKKRKRHENFRFETGNRGDGDGISSERKSWSRKEPCTIRKRELKKSEKKKSDYDDESMGVNQHQDNNPDDEDHDDGADDNNNDNRPDNSGGFNEDTHNVQNNGEDADFDEGESMKDVDKGSEGETNNNYNEGKDKGQALYEDIKSDKDNENEIQDTGQWDKVSIEEQNPAIRAGSSSRSSNSGSSHEDDKCKAFTSDKEEESSSSSSCSDEEKIKESI